MRQTAFLVLLAWGGNGCGVAQTQFLELRLEAAFLYNFARFVEWPPGTPASDPITFCVLGADPLYGPLQESLAGKTINGRVLAVRQIVSPQEAQRCQIAFVGWDGKKRCAELLDVVSGAPVLTVADFEQFARLGGMIELIKQGNKFRFAINVDAVNRSGLHASSKLLQLAEVIHEADGRRSGR